MNIAAFDPGVTTGVAVLFNGEYYAHQIDSRRLTEVEKTLRMWDNPDTIFGYEEFQFRPNQKAAELYSKEVIGVIRLYCEQREKSEPFKYTPIRAKKFWTDDKIQVLGIWKPGQPHAMDALRVLLTHRAIIDPEFTAEFTAVFAESQLRRPPVEKRRKSPSPPPEGPQLFLDPEDWK